MEIVHYSILKLVLTAIELVGYDYFKVKTSNDGIQNRERVFCYELYHRLRQIQDNYCKDLTINGELDKRGRSAFSDEKPDFLFHIPGTDDNNAAIIEVKNTRENIENDIQKMNVFIEKYKNQMGISIIYNQTFSSVEKHIKGIDELKFIKNKEIIFVIAASDPAHIKCKSLLEIMGDYSDRPCVIGGQYE
jgi:hypothetical protein